MVANGRPAVEDSYLHSAEQRPSSASNWLLLVFLWLWSKGWRYCKQKLSGQDSQLDAEWIIPNIWVCVLNSAQEVGRLTDWEQ